MLHPSSVEVVCRSPEETRAVGHAMGRCAGPGDLYLLIGQLGAGKTCLTQGILWGLGVDDYARSPTFVLVTQHRGRLPLFHVDLYRVETPEEVAELGLDEHALEEGICVVEWADRGAGFFPEDHLELRFEYLGENERRLLLTARPGRYDAVMDAVRSAASAR